MKATHLYYIVRGADGTTYDLTQSLSSAQAAKASLPYSIQRFARIYARIGDALVPYNLLNANYIAAMLNTTPESVELSVRLHQLDETSNLEAKRKLHGAGGSVYRLPFWAQEESNHG